MLPEGLAITSWRLASESGATASPETQLKKSPSALHCRSDQHHHLSWCNLMSTASVQSMRCCSGLGSHLQDGLRGAVVAEWLVAHVLQRCRRIGARHWRRNRIHLRQSATVSLDASQTKVTVKFPRLSGFQGALL